MRWRPPEPDLISDLPAYRPRPVDGFAPERIVLARGVTQRLPVSDWRKPSARRIHALKSSRRWILRTIASPWALRMIWNCIIEGKRTLVLAEHQSAVRQSTEESNSCPNYWHFSPYGFCPYGCGLLLPRRHPRRAVLANRQDIRELQEILAEVDRVARRLGIPTAFYLGKLQDGLALDPLTGYSRQIIPFFADHPLARLTLLTKSADVSNLLGPDHRGNSTLSWTVNPKAAVEAFEPNTPALEERICAMEACACAGYPVRAVVMPIIPLPEWETIYSDFLRHLLGRVRLARITLGSICSYPQAMRLTEQKLGPENSISSQLGRRGSGKSDGRSRFPRDLRVKVYRHLLDLIQRLAPSLEVGLCLEEESMFDMLGMKASLGRCNCVL